jgi:hypothetical protein
MGFQQIEFLNSENSPFSGTVQCSINESDGHFAITTDGETLVIKLPLLAVDFTRKNAIKKLVTLGLVALNGVEYLQKLPPAMEQKSTNG